MGTETTPYNPAVAQKLGAECEKLRLVYWLYNNDDNGCGPLQGMPITRFGDWTLDEFYCDGKNILANPVPISYSNFNDNFNEWAGALNPVSANNWDWVNAGRPCFRVMATITCDDTVYGDFLLTPVNVNPRFDGIQVLIQPDVIIGPEVEVLVCRKINKSGQTEKTFFDKAGDAIESLTSYYAQAASHIVVSDTGSFPFTESNIAKFYSEEDLCNCLKVCSDEYDEIDDTPPCIVEFQEGGCIYAKNEDGEFILPDGSTSETPAAFAENVSQSVLFDDQGSIKARTVVEGQFQENEDDNVELYSSYEPEASTLPDGWYYDQTCTGVEPAPPEPPACPEGTKLDIGFLCKHGAFADNSRWVGAPLVNMPNGPIHTIEALCDNGSTLQATGTSWWAIRDVFNAAGYETNVACANWAGCPPSGWPAWMPDPDIETLFARGWFGVGCKKKITKLTIVEHEDPAWVGVYKDIVNVDAPPETIFWANICGSVYAENCNGEPIFVEKCCIKNQVQQSGLLDDFKITKAATTTTVTYTNSDEATEMTVSVGSEGDIKISSGQGDDSDQAITSYIEACLSAGNDVNFSATGVDGSTATATLLHSAETNPFPGFYNDSTDAIATGEQVFKVTSMTASCEDGALLCALLTQGCNDDRRDDCLEEIKSLLQCPGENCPAINQSSISLVDDGSSVSYPLTAENEFKDHNIVVTLTDPSGCLASNPDAEISVRYLVDHEAGPYDAHRLYILIASAGTFTAQSASNSGGTVGAGNIQIGYNAGDGVAQVRNDRWVKLTATAAEWLNGITFTTGFFGGVGGAYETIHSLEFEICEGLTEICDGC